MDPYDVGETSVSYARAAFEHASAITADAHASHPQLSAQTPSRMLGVAMTCCYQVSVVKVPSRL